MKTTADSAANSPPQGIGPQVDPPAPTRPGRKAFLQIALDRRRLLRLVQNRFWLLIPVLVLDLALVGKLPPPLAPGSPGPDIPGWVSVSEAILRGLVFGVPLLMPLSMRAQGTRPMLAVYTVAFTAYAAAWVAVVWSPTSAWSTSAVGFTALAWTSILLFTGIGLKSRLRFFPGYRPWMYLGAAALFTVVHTLHMAIIWNWNELLRHG
jgi:hypothetical protein